ncbi:MAG: hypothetical protein ACK5PF_06415 [bacterium]
MNKKPSPWNPETDPARLKVLGKLSEELGELSSAVARCTIQGIDEAQPVTGKPNREWITEEIADVIACITLVRTDFNLDMDLIGTRAEAKLAYLRDWVEMS